MLICRPRINYLARITSGKIIPIGTLCGIESGVYGFEARI
jgi:hypothetical protein